MQTTTRTLTIGDLRAATSHLPDHMPLTVRAHVTCYLGDDEKKRDYVSLEEELSIEDVRQAINCVELHARD